ncbi:unnamed protein product [marine sediment metagenome]|uniref:Uncharacterized protein n=1 Tax=marine sediment metagenome TaxID=412755 RepID=X1TG62_9ZZZZ
MLEEIKTAKCPPFTPLGGLGWAKRGASLVFFMSPTGDTE